MGAPLDYIEEKESATLKISDFSKSALLSVLSYVRLAVSATKAI